MTDSSSDVVETARYKIFLNKTDKHVVVLQFPHLERSRPFTKELHNQPLQIRIKPKNGLVELDVPLPDTSHINQELAVKYGVAVDLHKRNTNSAPVGLSGGFGAAGPSRVKRQHLEHEREDVLVADFEHSLKIGKAMNFLTLTGQIKPSVPGQPSYYMGSFHGEELHLTRISAFCSMSVGLHHLDAVDLNEKATKRAMADDGASAEKTQFVGPQVKNVEEVKTEESEWKRRLRELQEEPWQKLEWVDESAEQSFDFFNEALFLDEGQKSNRILAVMTQKQYADSLNALKPGTDGDAVLFAKNKDESNDPYAYSSDEDTEA